MTLLGAGLLSHNGGVQNKRPVGAAQPASPLFLRHPDAAWGGRAACNPFTLVQGAGCRDGGTGSSSGGAGSHTGRLGASGRRVGGPDPAVGAPATGLANRHAALFEGRQRGQNHRPQPSVAAERKDALGEDKGLRDEGLTSNPLHQNLQLLPGQVGPWPTLHPDDVV
jgi:hypothetical protein